MLTLRMDQLASLRKARAREFLLELRPHVERSFPSKCRVLGEERLWLAMEFGVERAAAHGIDGGHAVARFFGLMVFFGSRFDSDTLLPWAEEILSRAELAGEVRIDRLYARGRPELAAMAGEQGGRYKRALARARAVPFERYPCRAAEARDHAEALVHEVFPQRLTRLPDGGLKRLVDRAQEIAQHHRLDPGAGTVLAAVLVALLGSGFPDDPLHPWAAEALRESEHDVLARTKRLHDAALAALRAYLEAEEG